MSLQETLTRGRAAAERIMTDTCRITATTPGQRGPLNPDTLKYDQAEATTVYEGRCRLRSPGAATAADAAGGEATWDTEDQILSLPVDSTHDVRPGAVVTYLTAPTNTGLVGRVFGVIAVDDSSHTTARRCRVREVTG